MERVHLSHFDFGDDPRFAARLAHLLREFRKKGRLRPRSAGMMGPAIAALHPLEEGGRRDPTSLCSDPVKRASADISHDLLPHLGR